MRHLHDGPPAGQLENACEHGIRIAQECRCSPLGPLRPASRSGRCFLSPQTIDCLRMTGSATKLDAQGARYLAARVRRLAAAIRRSRLLVDMEEYALRLEEKAEQLEAEARRLERH